MDNKLFEDIYNEANLLQKAGAAIANAGNTMQAKANVKQQQKDKQKQDNLNAATDNTNKAKNALATLQSIANEQKPFDAETIKSLMNDINELNVGDDVKKQINHILNSQNAALQKSQTTNNNAATNNNAQEQRPAANTTEQQDTTNNEQVVNKVEAALGKSSKGNSNSDIIKNYLTKAGISKDEAIAWINTFLK